MTYVFSNNYQDNLERKKIIEIGKGKTGSQMKFSILSKMALFTAELSLASLSILEYY